MPRQTLPRPSRPLTAGLVALLALVAAPITHAPHRYAPRTASVADHTVAGGVDVVVTGALSPATAAIEPGQTVRWHNESAGIRTITANGEQFASGAIPDGGGFAVGFPEVGTFRYQVDPGGIDGVVHVGALHIDGPDDDPVRDHLVALTWPEREEADLAIHPNFAFEASRTRILMGFVDTATVADANEVLARANTPILGVTPGIGTLLVGAPDRADFSALDAVLAQLRAEPAVEFAAMDIVEQPDAIPDPSPTPLDSKTKYDWDVLAPVAAPPADGGNWGLETARVPQAWNFRDAARTAPGKPTLVIVDTSFDTTHPDLAGLQLHEVCVGPDDCVVNQPDVIPPGESTPNGFHGTAVAGVAGGAFGAGGVPGVDPQARVVGVPFSHYRAGLEQIAALVDDIEAGELGDVAVINYSTGINLKRDEWLDNHADFECGPGVSDDAGASGPCTPSTHDETLAEFAQAAIPQRALLERLAARDVLWVASSGNNGAEFCDAGGHLAAATFPDTNCPFVPLRAESNSSGLWAGATWSSALPNPVLGVDGLGDRVDNGLGIAQLKPSNDRFYSSNIGGNISTADYMITIDDDGFSAGTGTSFSAPMVAGLASYLAAQPSKPSMPEIRDAILTWSRNDTGNGAAPRADVFWALASLPGALHALADVNDASADGNRRTTRDSNNAITGFDAVIDPNDPEAFTAPDGVVDMRDYRRFRDAYLHVCREGGGDAACPATADIMLDGDGFTPTRHPKFDLNGDRCSDEVIIVHTNYCDANEQTYPRFDFNGDGKLTLVDSVDMPYHEDGSPASGPGDAFPMTDLDVFVHAYDTPSSATWSADDLYDLIESGDVTVNGQGLLDAGATGVVVRAVDPGTTDAIEIQPVDPASGEAVLTIPAGRPFDIEATVVRAGGDDRVTEPGPFTVGIGEDRQVDLCGRIDLSASPVRKTRLPRANCLKFYLTSSRWRGTGSRPETASP